MDNGGLEMIVDKEWIDAQRYIARQMDNRQIISR
jgi:hypothetical protein